MAQTVDHIIPPEAIAELANVVNALLSPNDDRKAAEERLQSDWRVHRIEQLVVGLAQLMSVHESPEVRSLSAILLRRIVTKPPLAQTQAASDDDDERTVWALLPLEIRIVVQEILIRALGQETQMNVRHKICDTISDVADQISMLEKAEGEWPQLQQVIMECMKSPDATFRESGLRIVGTVPHVISAVPVLEFASTLASSLAMESADVRVSAIQAAVYYIQTILEDSDEAPKSKDRSTLTDLIPVMLNTLVSFGDDEARLIESIGFLVELAEMEPSLFRNQMPNLLEYIARLASNADIDSPARQAGVELLVTLAEARPQMVRKIPQFTATLVPLLLSWMASIEDSPQWHNTDDLAHDDDDNDEDYVYAEQAMDRLSIALGGNSMLSIAFNVIPSYLGDAADWKKRHAGLMAISVMGEGCHDVMKNSLNDIMNRSARDPHPRVRYAACNAIGQMCTDFTRFLQTEFNDLILTSLVPLMSDSENPRVQAHAAAALVNFMEDADKYKVVPSLPEIMKHLLSLLHTQKTYVQEQAITTIATVADCAEDAFQPFYNEIMPVLLQILSQEAGDKRFRLLRGKALESASLIGLAVGKDTFAQHSQAFLNILRVLQESEKEDDDPITSYLLVAWARVFKLIGLDFVPYLNIVIPPLLQSAAVKPDVAILDVDDEEDKYPAEEGWEFQAFGDKKLGIKTSILEDKHTALEMICTYARDLEEYFVPFVPESLKIAVPLMSFSFHEGVREAAASTVPLLFNCLRRANIPQADINAEWSVVREELFKSMIKEADNPEFVSAVMTAYYESIQYLGTEYVTPTELDQFVGVVGDQIDKYLQRAHERQKSRRDAEHDEEQEGLLRDDEEFDNDMLMEICNANHEIFKLIGVNFIPYFNKLVERYANFILDTTSEHKRYFGICVFGDVIEYCGAESWNYQSYFLQPMIEGLSAQAPNVRQASSYCIGVCAEKGGPQYVEACRTALDSLASMIVDPESRSIENVTATDNAVSAMGKICQHFGQSGAFDLNKILAFWLNALPILQDKEEVDPTYRYLMSLLDSSHPAILGENNANFPTIAAVLAKAIVSDAKLPDDLEPRMIAALRSIISVSGIDVSLAVAEERRQVLQSKLSL
ncbi:hypothetical protein HDU76_011870 [Blyttiomyces sp. JEL0837]|nr:hypothetical protein HDU76_011870 [Blyttiomyces sp. JEL0837]